MTRKSVERKRRQKDKTLTQDRNYRRWLKSVRNRAGSIQMIFTVIMSLGVFLLVSMIWLMMNNPIVAIINQSMGVMNDTTWNATLTTTRLQWDYAPWFFIFLFIISIFMGAYWFSKQDRPETVGYYR